MLLNSAQKTPKRIGFFLYDGLFVTMCHKCLNMFLVASICLILKDCEPGLGLDLLDLMSKSVPGLS